MGRLKGTGGALSLYETGESPNGSKKAFAQVALKRRTGLYNHRTSSQGAHHGGKKASLKKREGVSVPASVSGNPARRRMAKQECTPFATP